MKAFLEKRWWGGVSVIIALLLGLPALIQHFGNVNISWLAVTITLNAVLVIALTLVAIWNTRLKRKYENTSSLLEEAEELIKSFTKKPERQRILLPDPNCIWKLGIENSLLTELYGQAHGRAITRFQDAKLSDLAIIVYPYHHDRVSILFSFYSQWAKRECTYIITEVGDIRESVPSKPAEFKATFDELPWLTYPNWPQFIRKSCEKVGPLSQAYWTQYHIYKRAWEEPQWGISFRDGATGKEVDFSWDGKGEPIPKD